MDADTQQEAQDRSVSLPSCIILKKTATMVFDHPAQNELVAW